MTFIAAYANKNNDGKIGKKVTDMYNARAKKVSKNSLVLGTHVKTQRAG